MPDYRVEVYRRAAATERGGIDPFTAELESETSATDWQNCILLARVFARAYPDHIVTAVDAARAELGTDGLTDAQREEVLRNVEVARKEAALPSVPREGRS